MCVKTSRPTLVLAAFLSIAVLALDLSGQQRPGKNPNFSEGFRAFTLGDWQTAREEMEKALDLWPEDGEDTRVYGRWFEPYLPRYFLGVALYELGCYQQALYQLDASILRKKEIKGTQRKVEKLESLKLKSAQFVRQGIKQKEGTNCENES